MSDKPKFPRAAALDVARELCRRLKPCCDRLIVAGSLRRGKESVGDVEILFIPGTAEIPGDLFSTDTVNLAEAEIARMLEDGTLTKRLSISGSPSWGPRNKLAVHRSGIPVDLFTATPESWWNYLVCRTGPSESNVRIATIAQERGYQWNPYGQGFTRRSDGTVIPMESEAAVFEFVGMEAKEPGER